MSLGAWNIYACKECFNELVNLVNQMLLGLGEWGEKNYGQLGAFCDRCEERKVGSIYIVRKTTLRETVIVEPNGGSHKEIMVWGEPRNFCYCESCWTIMNQSHVAVLKGRDVFLQEDVDEKVVANLWEDRLEKTESSFTLIPTETLRSLVARIPKKRDELEDLAARS